MDYEVFRIPHVQFLLAYDIDLISDL